MKQYIYIIIGVVAVIVIGIAAFWFFTSRNQAPVTPVGTGTTGTLPQTGAQSGAPGVVGILPTGTGTTSTAAGSGARFGVISSEPVLDYFVDAKNTVTVVEPDGKIAAIINGQAAFLSSAQIQNVLGAHFSYDGAKVFVSFGDPGNPQTSIFDATLKAWTPLPVGILSPAWSPSDYRIAYLKQNADGTEFIATLDAARPKNAPVTLLQTNMQDLSLGWPNKAQMVLSDKPSAYAEGSAWVFNLQKKTLSQPISDGYGLETKWSATTSSWALAFTTAALGRSGGTLSLWSPAANSAQNLNFLTLPSKCAFHYEGMGTASSPSYLALYCAVPGDQNALANAHLPDDYEQMSLFTADAFYKINTDTGVTENIFAPSQGIDATDLRLVNQMLFFVNRYDQKLYAISV